MGKCGLVIAVFVLAVLNGALLFYLLHEERELQVTFLNVGQGDAILIQTREGRQVLIDGGPDRSVLRQLPRFMGPLDRSIDLMIATHPDKDHIAGLAEVFARYEVSAFMEPEIANDTSYAQALTYAAANEEGVTEMIARRGMRIHLGEGTYMDVLFPDRDVEYLESNTGSILLQLVHGETEFMLTGDAPASIEEWLVLLDGEELQSDVLKAGHHGSRTSTSGDWIKAVSPAFVVISAGKENSYGHPHAEVVERIQASGAAMLSTMEGSITFMSDGKMLKVK